MSNPLFDRNSGTSSGLLGRTKIHTSRNLGFDNVAVRVPVQGPVGTSTSLVLLSHLSRAPLTHKPGAPLPRNPNHHFRPNSLLPNTRSQFVNTCFLQYPQSRRTQLRAILISLLDSQWWLNRLRPPSPSDLDQFVESRTVTTTVTIPVTWNTTETRAIVVYIFRCRFCDTDHNDPDQAQECVHGHMNIT
jgi:hypothetical protein